MKIRNQIALILTATAIFLLGCSKENKDNQATASREGTSKLPVDAIIVKLEL